MRAKELATIVDTGLHQRLKDAGPLGAPFVVHVLGPPSIGKTFLQDELFLKWAELSPCYLRVSSFVLDRDVRLARSLSECTKEAYDLPALRRTFDGLMAREPIMVRHYDHTIGRKSGNATVRLVPSDLVYIEGPIWLECSGAMPVDLTVLMQPADMRQWYEAYMFRNTQIRNYSVQDAKKAFGLASAGWQNVLRTYEGSVPDMSISVEFTGWRYTPNYYLSILRGDVGEL
jgi:uridine kinase